MDVTSAHGQKGVYQKRSCEGLFGPEPCPHSQHTFDHPIFQTWCMFFGEIMMLCLFAFKAFVAWKRCKGVTVENSRFNCLIFLFPACCDIIGSGMMMIALTKIYPSAYQMMSGAVIIFTSVLSLVFLGKKLWLNHWLGMLFVFGGLFVTGVGSHLSGQEKGLTGQSQLSGNLLVIAAQVILAVQNVYEEKVVKKHNVPALQAVGWEGVWGFTLFGLLLVPFYYIHYSFSSLQPPRFENTVDAALQMTHSWQTGVATVFLILSIALLNFCGMSVTKEMSATTREVLDSVRNLFVWAFALVKKWAKFHYMQPVGYSLLVMGILVYYNLVLLPRVVKIWKKWKNEEKHGNENAPLLTGKESMAS